MKQILFFPLLCAVGLFFVCGCTVIREVPQTKAQAKTEDASQKLSRALVKAFLKNDASAFLKLLPEETAKGFSKKDFELTRKNITESLGTPVSFEYVTSLELAVFTPQIWKIRFKRTDRSGKHTFYSEVLFRVITGKTDKNKVVITGFQFL